MLAVPIIGYLLGPALKKGSATTPGSTLGPLSDFPEGETRLVNYRNPVTTSWDGQTGDIPCWVRRVSGDDLSGLRHQLRAPRLSRCAGSRSRKLFLCPCHGGAYYADGSRASGPPERGLFEYEHKIAEGQPDDQRRQDADAGQPRPASGRR